MKYKAGIVGCGRIGSEFDDDPKRKQISTHAGAYRDVDDVELIAACDLDKDKLERCGKRWQIPLLYQDLGEMLKNKFDILSICTPSTSHLDIVKEAVKSGVKAIFCEKPIADSLQSAGEMIRLCHSNGVILQIDHQRRFDRFHQEVRDFIQDGKLGRIQQVSFYYTAGIANTGSHMFDLLRFFFGDVMWVQAVYSKNDSRKLDDPNVDGMMQFCNLPFCTIQSCDVQSYLIFEMDCLGTRGRLKITRSGFGIEYYDVGESKMYSGYNEVYLAPSLIDETPSDSMIVAGVKHLIKCLREGRLSISSGEDGRAALELVSAFRESADRAGTLILVPLTLNLIEGDFSG